MCISWQSAVGIVLPDTLSLAASGNILQAGCGEKHIGSVQEVYLIPMPNTQKSKGPLHCRIFNVQKNPKVNSCFSLNQFPKVKSLHFLI